MCGLQDQLACGRSVSGTEGHRHRLTRRESVGGIGRVRSGLPALPLRLLAPWLPSFLHQSAFLQEAGDWLRRSALDPLSPGTDRAQVLLGSDSTRPCVALEPLPVVTVTNHGPLGSSGQQLCVLLWILSLEVSGSRVRGLLPPRGSWPGVAPGSASGAAPPSPP